jgi:serine protease Do
MDIEQQLLTKGKVRRGRLGVSIQEVSQGLADSFGLDKPRGALVSSVDAGSPAAKAGIQPGDVILKFNGKEIESSSQLPAMVGSVAPGSEVRMEIWRQGSTRELRASVGEMKNLAARDAKDSTAAKSTGKLGLDVRPLTGEEKGQVDGGRGLVVEDVGDGPAARAGIQPGDVILAANGERVSSIEQLRKQVERAGKTVAVLVQRGEHKMFVPVKIG